MVCDAVMCMSVAALVLLLSDHGGQRVGGAMARHAALKGLSVMCVGVVGLCAAGIALAP